MSQPKPEPKKNLGRTRSLIRFGCSSFSSDDWVGPFYPQGTKPADYLRHYAEHFDTVEIDATYYGIPRHSMVDGWREKTPEGFLISAKFPRSIVHAGDGAQPDGPKVLDPKRCAKDTGKFLEAMSRLGDRLGTLVLQFPYFSRQSFEGPERFFDRLDLFLAELPGEMRYAVEIRNRGWLAPAYADLCRTHRASMVLVDQAWMPHGDEVEDLFDPLTGDHLYVRLLGDRKEIESITQTWDVEVIDRRERLQRWANFLTRMSRRGVPALIYVNNHYAGHAPTTARRLQEMVARTMEEPR